MRLLGLVLVGALAAPAVASADVRGPQIVKFLNAQRAANGIPAGIAEDPALSAGCAQHNAYGRQNDILTHEQEPGLPGASQAGADAAAAAVLYQGGDPWSRRNNPFETAPIHLAGTLAPRLDRMGAAETGGYGCATTLASRARPAPAADVVYTYPGDRTAGWSPGAVAEEAPYTPGERVGIPAGTRTGPYLYAFPDGPDLDPATVVSGGSATLRGPGGAVPVRVADNATPGLEDYLPPVVIAIPPKPLRPWTRYTAQLQGTANGRVFAKRFTFTTTGDGDPFALRVRPRGRSVTLRFTARLPLDVTVKAGKRVVKRQKLPGSGRITVRRPDGFAPISVVVRAAGGTYRVG